MSRRTTEPAPAGLPSAEDFLAKKRERALRGGSGSGSPVCVLYCSDFVLFD